MTRPYPEPRGRLEICKAFTFEAAHYFNHQPAGHPNNRIHGHSFRVDVVVSGTPDAQSGWIVDLSALAEDLAAIRSALDHRLLNEVEGLDIPSLENIARYIAGRLQSRYPSLDCVTVSRPSCFESATFRADPNLAHAPGEATEALQASR